MISNKKRQRITESMSLLDKEKEALSSNTYLQVAEALADNYKAVEGFYVLKWISIVPVVQPYDEESGNYVAYKQTPCSSVLPLTLKQVGTIKTMIQFGTSSTYTAHCSFWENIGYTSVPLFGRNLHLGEDIDVHETSVIMSLVEYTGPIV